MNINPTFPGEISFMAIGYKYKYFNVLGFIATEGGGSSKLGNPYLSFLPDNHSNVSICPGVCPCMIGSYFKACNEIYNHNSIWKSELDLDKIG